MMFKNKYIILFLITLSILSIHSSKRASISINLYRISNAEKLTDIIDLENELVKAKSSKVNLYKMTEDLAMIFLNDPDPFLDVTTIPYKMLFGLPEDRNVSVGELGGFLPGSAIPPIIKWIQKHKINSPEGFAKMYANLSAETKKALEEIGSPGVDDLYKGYVKPLVAFYDEAAKNNNSIVVIGE